MKKGFTLIELMIVVAIIGILSMIAMPAYQDYVKRSYVAEGFTNLSPIKLAMLEYYLDHSDFPDYFSDLPAGSITTEPLPNGSAGDQRVKLTSKMYAYIYYGGVLALHVTDEIEEGPTDQHPMEVMIIPSVTEGSIRWVCGIEALQEFPHLITTQYGYNDLDSKYLPSECRS